MNEHFHDATGTIRIDENTHRITVYLDCDCGPVLKVNGGYRKDSCGSIVYPFVTCTIEQQTLDSYTVSGQIPQWYPVGGKPPSMLAVLFGSYRGIGDDDPDLLAKVREEHIKVETRRKYWLFGPKIERRYVPIGYARLKENEEVQITIKGSLTIIC